MSEPRWTWREEVERARSAVGDATPIVAWEPSEAAFDIQSGTRNLPSAVRAYSETRVYFVVTYDGGVDVWIDSVPRHPGSGAPIEGIDAS